ncbi:hypothetical protein BGY98DRAFT_1101602 [Russula aff. rugulosa BPL654]|nr:hypothetical protein BGY98DRAFT_1101602 [Russula aff. rugulosa BPL654]
MSPLLPHHRITGPVTFHTPASPVASTSPQLTILPITRIDNVSLTFLNITDKPKAYMIVHAHPLFNLLGIGATDLSVSHASFTTTAAPFGLPSLSDEPTDLTSFSLPHRANCIRLNDVLKQEGSPAHIVTLSAPRIHVHGQRYCRHSSGAAKVWPPVKSIGPRLKGK